MDIQNLKQDNTKPLSLSKINIYHFMIILLAIFTAFWLSRFLPMTKSTSNQTDSSLTELTAISSDKIKNEQDIKIGQVYGNSNGNFKDSATGYIRKGNINGVGTHILERQGGLSQRASLTSSVIDLDLFIDKKVEIKGETNTSDKTSWLMDVGSIKVLE